MRRDRDRRSASLLTRLNRERFFAGAAAFDWDSRASVSYTHLDVYKRQASGRPEQRPRRSEGCRIARWRSKKAV